MLSYILRRLAGFIPILLIIATLTYFLIRVAPGGPFEAERHVAPEVLEQLKVHYNLGGSWPEQYVRYMGMLVRGDLGPSLKQNRTVNELIAQGFPVSLELGAYGLLVALGLGLAAGISAALAPNTWRDHVPMSFAMIGIGVPNFVLGPLLVLVFALWLDLLPSWGWDAPASKVLPSITLGLMYAAYIARLSRGGMLEVLSQDFIRTARAKGLSESRVVLRHGLWGGLQPVVAFLGPAAAGLLTGSFVVENIFAIPGLGTYFVEAATNRDYTLIMGTVLFYASLLLLFNLIVDVALAWLDPRLRLE
jgi:oligopeptide transport system permease protein